jgi:maleylacetoacetate isomerase
MFQLYGYWRSQAAYRVRIAMALKGQEWKEELVDLLKGEQFSGAVAKHNPHHTVPVLIDGPTVLTQSLAIIEYLNEIYPSPPLLPADPLTRARVRALSLIAVADCHSLVVPRARKRLTEQFKATPADITAWSNYWQTLALTAMERALNEREKQTPFCFGNTPGLADICLAGHVAGCQNSETPFEGFPRVVEINNRCHQLPAFRDNHPWVIRDQGAKG